MNEIHSNLGDLFNGIYEEETALLNLERERERLIESDFFWSSTKCSRKTLIPLFGETIKFVRSSIGSLSNKPADTVR